MRLEKLQCILKAEKANTWSDEHWESWLVSWRELNEVFDFIAEAVKEQQKYLESVIPSAYILGLPNATLIRCPDTMRLKLFLESMRQQLAHLIMHPELECSLICPFKGESPTCCGFGNNLRGIWTGIPNKFRRRMKLPLQVCLS
jgi:hypothetical protein